MSPTLFDLHVLAKSSSTSVSTLVLALGVVVALTGGLLAALAVIRRRMREDAAQTPRDFSLGDLRSLHREGKLSDEEFERAKAKLVSGVRSTLQKEAKPSMVEQPFQEELKDA